MRTPFLFLVLAIFVLAGMAAYYWDKAQKLQSAPPVIIEKESGVKMEEPEYASSDWKTWKDSIHNKVSKVTETYTLKYPRDFEVRSGTQAIGGFLDNPKVTIKFPPDAFQTPKSNFSESYLTLSTDATRSTEEKCFDWPQNLQSLSITRDIGGLTFRGGAGSEAAAGNLYSSKVYRSMFNKRCYELALTVHTGNIGNYPEDTASFDEEKAFSILDKVFTTFMVATSTESNP